MPDKTTHLIASATTGLAAAAYRARYELPAQQIPEVLGGALGGALGGRLPDLLEPATSPRHRDLAHSVVALLGVASISLEEARSHCLEQAALAHARLEDPTLTPVARFWHELLEFIWRLFAGALTGLQAGYVTHLFLDACTPAGLPLLAT